jgi:hypothetical protein
LGLAGEADFSRSLSPDEFKAAGLDRLSPAELKRLDELVMARQNSDVAAARRAVEEARQARLAAEAATKAAKVAALAAEAEAKAAKAEVTDAKKGNQAFQAKAKVMLVPGTQIEYAVIKSTIAGKFEGWDRNTIFVLANGQRWQVANSGDRYFTPPKDDVEVEIAPAALGGYWMYCPRLKVQVRVKLLAK